MEALPAVAFKRDFGQMHFGSAQLGDARRSGRLVRVAQTLLENPSGTLPQRVRDHAELIALYRLMDADSVTHESVLEPHRARTLALMRQTSVVLVVHDANELDYTGRTTLRKVGQIGNGGGRGYVCHNSLAVTPQREVIGLACQILHTRRRVPAGETPAAKRRHPRRESRLWPAACAAIGPAPEGRLWIDVSDAGSDTFEFAAYELRHGRHFVIRSARDRNLAGEDHVGADRVYQKLYAYTRDLPDLGTREVPVPAVPGKSKARTAVVRVAAGPVSIAAPHFARGETDGEASLDLWVVHVREVDPPAGTGPGARPLEWVLLSDLPAGTFDAACRVVDYYQCRPMIEEFHKSKKTGCGIERAQFELEERLEPLIALLSVVSVVLLQLRQLARDPQSRDTPADVVVPKLYVRVLSAWRHGGPQPMSVYEFCMALARLGGHLGRKGDGFPGWLTLWRGWADLMLMVKGVKALRGEDV